MVKACLSIALAIALPISAVNAQAKLKCTGDIYQVQSGQLRIFDTKTSTYTNIGPKNPSYNSLAYNPQDDLLYGTRAGGVVRIDANGVMTDLFAIGFNAYVGDIDDANNMYLRRNNTTMTRVNLASQQQENITLSQPLASGAADWAFVDTPVGKRLIAPGRTQLSLINADTGENVVRTIANFPSEGSSGATWSDVNGRVFTFRNTTGNVYEILDYLTPDPRAVLVAVGDPSNSNDGSSCRRMPFPNFPPIAFDDAYTTRFQTELTGENFIIGNSGETDNDPDGGPVFASAALISTPENGTVAHFDDGSFIYTPDDGFSGKDSFVYEISDATGLKAKATVTITVTRPRLSVSKRSLAISSAGPSAFFIPGNQVAYEIEVENSGNQEVDANTLFIVDSWPADVSFAADQSVTWEDSASGLDFNQSRDVGYSDSAIKPASLDQCTYDPAPGYDPAVRFICINPQGALSPDGSARFSMRGRIN